MYALLQGGGRGKEREMERHGERERGKDGRREREGCRERGREGEIVGKREGKRERAGEGGIEKQERVGACQTGGVPACVMLAVRGTFGHRAD